MEFVETHGHFDDDAFANDLPQVIEAAQNVGVSQFINIGYEPKRWIQSLSLAKQYSGFSYALGIHPNAADLWTSDVASDLERLLSTTDAVAIGETGLDYYREWADHAAQRRAFHEQMELASRFSLPVVIHMRGDVETEIREAISVFPAVRAVYHSFDGSAELRDFALDRGDVIGVGGLMTRAGSSELRETLRAVPITSMVLETDSPYLTPKGVKDRRNTSANLPIIAEALADLLGIDAELVAEQTTANAQSVFKLRSGATVGGAL